MDESKSLSVIIPALNEVENLPGILQDLSKIEPRCEVVVVDGGSDDGTCETAMKAGVRVISARRGRASQLNAGATAARGEWLCFLHADVRMSDSARLALEEVVADARTDAAVWRFAVDGSGVWFRLVEFGALLRDRLAGLPYGDQGLLVRRDLFFAVGGFPRIPVMEDVAIVRALRSRVRIKRLRAPLLASPRRWHREGPVRTWLRNVALVMAYLVGVSPERLARWYRPESG